MIDNIPNTQIVGQNNAFQEWTHFLDQRGMHSHRISGTRRTPDSRPLQPPSAQYETAWTHTEHFVELHIDTNGKHEQAITKRRTVGDLMLATMRNEDGEYVLMPLKEIAEGDDIPIYTAAWLSRYVKTWKRDSYGQLDQPAELYQLKVKPAMKILTIEEIKKLFPDKRAARGREALMSFAREERARRLAYEVIWEFPHLTDWYEMRHIPIQNDQTYEAVMEAFDQR